MLLQQQQKLLAGNQGPLQEEEGLEQALSVGVCLLAWRMRRLYWRS
jgi:hypothetical protein